MDGQQSGGPQVAWPGLVLRDAVVGGRQVLRTVHPKLGVRYKLARDSFKTASSKSPDPKIG